MSRSGFWDEEKIKEAIRVYRHDGKQGLTKISKKYNRDITFKAVDRASRRYLGCSVTNLDEQGEPAGENKLDNPVELPEQEALGQPSTPKEDKERILEQVRSLPPLTEELPDYKLEEHEEVAFLDVSDVHMGSSVDPEEVGNVAHYDENICFARMQVLMAKLQNIVEQQRKGGAIIKRVVINFLGDIVDGEDIYRGHARNVSVFTNDQLFKLGDRWPARFFEPIQKLFDRVDCYCVYGNHGRLGRKGDMSSTANLDHFLYLLWKMRYKERDQKIAFHISKGPWLAYRELGRVHIIAHGDTVKGYNGIPFYGLSRLMSNYQNMIGHPVFALHIGHFHSPVSIPTGRGGRLSINGAWPGGSDFSINKLSTASLPSQWLRFLNHRGVCSEWNLELDNAVLLPTRDGALTPIC